MQRYWRFVKKFCSQVCCKSLELIKVRHYSHIIRGGGELFIQTSTQFRREEFNHATIVEGVYPSTWSPKPDATWRERNCFEQPRNLLSYLLQKCCFKKLTRLTEKRFPPDPVDQKDGENVAGEIRRRRHERLEVDLTTEIATGAARL